MNPRLLLFLSIAVGGTAVLASYVWGFTVHSDVKEGFWGGVPKDWIPIYTANMPLAAIGFMLAFTLFLRFADEAQLKGLHKPYWLVLLPSALWLPLTVWILKQPADWLWFVIRLDLFLVAIGAVWIMHEMRVLKDKSGQGGWHLTASWVGMGFFFLQVGILDAFVWPYFFIY